jgi:hypothetical protein
VALATVTQEPRAVERLNDEEAIEKALSEREREHRDGMSEADKLPPPFKNQDWTPGGPALGGP